MFLYLVNCRPHLIFLGVTLNFLRRTCFPEQDFNFVGVYLSIFIKLILIMSLIPPSTVLSMAEELRNAPSSCRKRVIPSVSHHEHQSPRSVVQHPPESFWLQTSVHNKRTGLDAAISLLRQSSVGKAVVTCSYSTASSLPSGGFFLLSLDSDSSL